MAKIAYVTDLHFGAPQTRARMDSFGIKITRLPRDTRAVCFSGDIFALPGVPPVWKPMVEGPLSGAEIEERRNISKQVVDEWAPQLFAAIPKGLSVFMIPGNADILGYEYLAALGSAGKQHHYIDGKAIKAGNAFNILGAGSITPDNGDAVNILNYNPWYKGVISAVAFDQVLNGLLALTNGWGPEDRAKTILMTHMPALGHVDQYKGQSQGSAAVLAFISSYRPLLHLTGHVHEGPFMESGYLPYSIIEGQTVSINAGGGVRHDSESGVRILSVDFAALAEAREQKRLEAAAAGAVVSI